MVCEECDWHGTANTVLTATNPFDENSTISGCPQCKSVATMRYACDEPGCWLEARCGYPVKDGYRNTCAGHYTP